MKNLAYVFVVERFGSLKYSDFFTGAKTKYNDFLQQIT
jgi:hypothetical protein